MLSLVSCLSKAFVGDVSVDSDVTHARVDLYAGPCPALYLNIRLVVHWIHLVSELAR